jgi:hypothetical protein
MTFKKPLPRWRHPEVAPIFERIRKRAPLVYLKPQWKIWHVADVLWRWGRIWKHRAQVLETQISNLQKEILFDAVDLASIGGEDDGRTIHLMVDRHVTTGQHDLIMQILHTETS